MRYILKEKISEEIRQKYKNSYIKSRTQLCDSYISQILNRKVALKKNVAYTFTKMLDERAEIEDYFDIK